MRIKKDQRGRNYGTLTLWTMLIFGVAFIAIFISLGLIDAIFNIVILLVGLFVCIMGLATTIRITEDKILIGPLIGIFSRKHVIFIDEIERIEIEPSLFFGNTAYKFYLKDNRYFETYGKLLRKERKVLIIDLKAQGINVVLRTDLF